MSSKNEYTIKDLIQKMLKSYQIEDKVQETELRQSWEKLMGSMIDKHTVQLAIKNEKLYLKVDSPVLRQELSYGKSLIIEKVNDHYGKAVIKDVVLR
ncbi:MAG: hypothetical protein CL840_07715 [Crocinitomicaceae bacterium]|mgnify:CR=1 FL=1|nr:hypothetical protein [Crocinitomicaceae bacterium]|tara:strand:- start:210 stop:500 length:291 start_codon:yes stop_codon:yes gene_type:complete